MKMKAHSLILIVVLTVLVAGSTALKFQIFKDFDYKGLFYETNEDEVTDSKVCKSLQSHAQGIAGSVRTDTCVIGYEEENCNGFSTKLQPNTASQARYMRPLKSYHLCNSTHGGNKLHVILYNQNNKRIAAYPDVCGCQDLPAHISTEARQLANHMNCVKVYQTNECTGKSLEIPGGKSQLSIDLKALDSYVRSISACGDKPVCVRNIYKFQLVFNENTRSAVKSSESKNVEMAAKTTFYNNGSATITQQYSVSKTLKQSMTFTKSASQTEATSSSLEYSAGFALEADMEGEWEEGDDQEECNEDEEECDDGSGDGGDDKKESKKRILKLAANLDLKGALPDYYKTSSSSSSSSSSTSAKIEVEKTFEISQSIQINPCTQYEVSSTVSISENVPITYDVFAKFTGNASGVPLTADQIISQVSEMTWVENLDEYTAIYKTRDVMHANAGVDTWITGEGSKIEKCFKGKSRYLEQMVPQMVNNAVRKYTKSKPL